MSGYTPVFSTVFTGTLHGRWPDTGLWLCLLAMADKHGLIDCTPQYIAGVTGLSADDVVGCIERFTKPDPYSRSQAEEGRRLVPIDVARPWGWRIVNHGKYREKARLQAKDAQRTASGADAERKRTVPRSPPVSPAVPLSDSDANTDSDTRKNKRAATPPAPSALVLPEGLPRKEWEEWLALRRKRRWPVDDVTLGKQLATLAEHPTETQRQMINTSINAGWQGIFAPKVNGSAKPKWIPPLSVEQLEEAERLGLNTQEYREKVLAQHRTS